MFYAMALSKFCRNQILTSSTLVCFYYIFFNSGNGRILGPLFYFVLQLEANARVIITSYLGILGEFDKRSSECLKP